MYAVSFIYSDLSPHCFPFSSFQGKFFSLQGQWSFFTVTTVNDCLFHQTFRVPHRPRVWPLVWIAVTNGNSIPSLRIFTIWQVAGFQRSMRRPPRIIMQNGPPFIIDTSSPGCGSWGGVFHKCSDIYKPPTKIASYQGMLNRYFPSQETPRCWRARSCPSDTRLGGGGWGVVYWTSTLWHGDSNTPPKMNFVYYMWNIPDTRRPKINMVRSWYLLGWCLCQDKPYGTIILITISLCAYKDNYKLWSFYHFIFEHQQIYCIITEARFEFSVVFILLQLSFSWVLYVILCMIVFMTPLRSNSTFFVLYH